MRNRCKSSVETTLGRFRCDLQEGHMLPGRLRKDGIKFSQKHRGDRDIDTPGGITWSESFAEEQGNIRKQIETLRKLNRKVAAINN
jgi:hypothetical protein